MSTSVLSVSDAQNMLHAGNPPVSPLSIRNEPLLPFQKEATKPKTDAKSQIRSDSELEQSWRECERKLGGKFATAVLKIFEPIIKMIGESIGRETAPRNDDKGQSVVNRITNFLKDDKSRHMDDCILWQLLVSAIEEEDHLEAQQTLIGIILSISPHLAFDSPTRPGKGRTIKSDCKHSKEHSNNKPRSTSRPLDMIVRSRNVLGLQHVLHHAQRFCTGQIVLVKEERRFSDIENPNEPHSSWQGLLLALLQQKETSEEDDESDKKRPLERLGMKVARDGDKNPECLKAIDILLEHNPEIASFPDRTFIIALEKGCQNLIDKFLSKKQLVRRFVTSENILRALEIVALGKGGPNHPTIVESLVQHADSDQLKAQVVEKLIEHNFQQLWHDHSPRIKVDNSNSLLHIAVRHQNVAFVRIFLDKLKDSVQKEVPCLGAQNKPESKYPLWHNNKVLKNNDWIDRPDSSKKKLIRSMIVTATISRVPKMQNLCNIFRLSQGMQAHRVSLTFHERLTRA